MIDTVQAATASTHTAAASAGDMSQYIIMIVFVVVFYFLLLRPQQKQRKAQEQMINSVKVGDEVVTKGGVLGKVTKISKQFLHVLLAQDTVIIIQRQAINTVLPKGTIKSAS